MKISKNQIGLFMTSQTEIFQTITLKHYLTALLAFGILLAIGCKSRPSFEGTWMGGSGMKLVITKVNDNSYDVKAYRPNENIGDKTNSGNSLNGEFTYSAENKSIFKATDGIGLRGFEITYSDGKLYFGGDKGGEFFIKQ